MVWVRYYGRQHLGSIRGTVWCLTVAGSGCGPLITGIAKDWTGSFDLAVLAFLLAILPLSVGVWFATDPTPERSK